MRFLSNICFAMLLSFCCQNNATAQGWPANYDGIMLQGFYWDSYTDTQWSNLESHADELSQYFNLVWVPQSGYCNSLSYQMGYGDIWWLDHKSAFGTEAELRSMIKTFKQKGIGTIADVVVNHKGGNKSWTDFPNETKVGENTGKTYSIQWGTDCAPYICSTDECVKAGYRATGAYDTGDDFDGSRDLDHTNATVQRNIKTYVDFLINELGYSGFRYDMVKGFGAKYVGMYNSEAKPMYSVGECWDGDVNRVKQWINGTKVDADGKASVTVGSAAFDFPMRYNIKDAFSNGSWAKLGNACLALDNDYKRYAVTFVDNHDTGSSGKGGADPLFRDIEAANAFILAMPGTPCVFLPHWKTYGVTIRKLITLRKLLGIHNQSNILERKAIANGYCINVEGIRGRALVVFGTGSYTATGGYKLAMEGQDFRYYVSEGVDVSALDKIKEDNGFVAPECCEVKEGEVCAFFEAPSSWTNTIKCWCWGTKNYTGGAWPGAACELVGTTTKGNRVYKWTYSETDSVVATGIIFSNNGTPQTADLPFKAGGYYTQAGLQGVIEVKKEGVDGDVTGDGIVDKEDVSAVVDVICGASQYADKADVNKDGQVNIIDVSFVVSQVGK